MPSVANSLALAALASAVNAAYQGFNYGNTFTTGQIKAESDYEAEFKAAQGLTGTDGAFNSARLYTMIQGGSTNDPIAAIPAAISTKTSLLLGLWASAGQDTFNNELAALKSAIEQYGDDFASVVVGISVGSEDLYRNSPTGIANDEYAGANPDTLVDYINSVRDLIKGTSLEGAKIGHVDTWTSFVNGSNQAVIDACDWLGFDGYPYFQDTDENAIANGAQLFNDALAATKGAAGGKEVWITETGWPVSGKDFGQAVASTENAETYWNEVGCPLFGSTNVWWYTLLDAAPDTPNPSFGIIQDLNSEPLYDLSCDGSSSGSNGTTGGVSTGVASTGLPVRPLPTSGGSNDNTGGVSTGVGLPIPPSPTGGSGTGGGSYGNGTETALPTGTGSSGSTSSSGSDSSSGSEDPDNVSGSSGPSKLDSIAASVIALIAAVTLF